MPSAGPLPGPRRRPAGTSAYASPGRRPCTCCALGSGPFPHQRGPPRARVSEPPRSTETAPRKRLWPPPAPGGLLLGAVAAASRSRTLDPHPHPHPRRPTDPPVDGASPSAGGSPTISALRLDSNPPPLDGVAPGEGDGADVREHLVALGRVAAADVPLHPVRIGTDHQQVAAGAGVAVAGASREDHHVARAHNSEGLATRAT